MLRCRPARSASPSMLIAKVAAVTYAAAIASVVAFQLGLASGAPWGEYACGGAYSGRLPSAIRVVSVVQAVLLAATAAVVTSRAGLFSGAWTERWRRPIWAVVGLMAISLLLNL